jgi:DNA gyrase inhibitor GyrI
LECIQLSERLRTRIRTSSTFLLIVASVMFSTACSVFGVESVEEAPYQTVLKENEFEIRDYAPFVVAQTRIDASYKEAGNKAFRKLFAYISGENESSAKIAMTAPVIAESKGQGQSEKIAMTAPVISEQDGEVWVYRFVLPKGFTVDSAPRPLNPDVTIAQTAPQRVATIRYSGRSTDKARVENTKALVKWIASEGLVQKSAPRWAGYNAPWTLPPLRRNEVLIDVDNP